MPIEIKVADFPDQTGETKDDAIAALQAVDADVLVVVSEVYDDTAPVDEVLGQVVEAVAIEEAGGPVGSHGVQVTLSVSKGPVPTYAGIPMTSAFGGLLQGW